MQICETYFPDSLVALGKFRCPVSHPVFHDAGRARGHLVVFPREPVEIRQVKREPVIANSNVVVLYNKDQEYERRQVSPWGDRCEFLNIKPELLRDLIRPYRESIDDRVEQPFEFPSFVSSSKLVLKQRQLVDLADNFRNDGDVLAWESSAIDLLADSIGEAFKSTKLKRQSLSGEQQDLVINAQDYLSVHFQKHFSLETMAAAIDSSPYHLCRTFKKFTGMTVHAYLTHIRMRTALEWVREIDNLTRIALDLGYSSHSHFSAVFKRCFGLTPRQWRGAGFSPKQ